MTDRLASTDAQPAASRSRRFGELDSIRGIAALVVVMHHCIITATPPSFHARGGDLLHRLATEPRLWLEFPPLRLLFAGQAAVGVFFVLSGFVLSLPLLSNRQLPYPHYLVKRFFRIYVPFAVAIALAAAACALVKPVPIPELNAWFNSSWMLPVTPQLVLGHLAMSGKYITLDNPMWSLIPEVRISLVFPALALMVIRRPGWGLICSFLLTLLLTTAKPVRWLSGLTGQDTGQFLMSLEDTAELSFYFVIGIAMAAKLDLMTDTLRKLRFPVRAGLWSLALLGLEAPPVPLLNLVYFPLGATLLIALCLSSPRARMMLNHPSLHWLGRVSYSLYLTHLIVLLLMTHLFYGMLPLWLLLIIIFFASLVTAELMCRLVEIPAQRLGQILGGRKAPPIAPVKATVERP